jgi:hypothetical protein
MKSYDIYIQTGYERYKKIGTVFHNAIGNEKAEREDDVKKSLVNHDGYRSDIVVIEK